MPKEVEFNGMKYYQDGAGGLSIWPYYIPFTQLDHGFKGFWKEYDRVVLPRGPTDEEEIKLVEQHFNCKLDAWRRGKPSSPFYEVAGFIFNTEEDMLEFILKYA